MSEIGKHATTVNIEINKTIVRYHNTDIVKFSRFWIRLDSGGYNTPTTKRRMNQVSKEFNLGYRVYQEDFKWYVNFKGREIFFEDGMLLERF